MLTKKAVEASLRWQIDDLLIDLTSPKTGKIREITIDYDDLRAKITAALAESQTKQNNMLQALLIIRELIHR